jgi:hypothetical protein
LDSLSEARGREPLPVVPAFHVAKEKRNFHESLRVPAAESDLHGGTTQAVGSAMSHASHLQRTHALLDLISHLLPEEFAGTADAALNLPRDLATEALQLIYEEWAKRDPQVACEHGRAKAGNLWDLDRHRVRRVAAPRSGHGACMGKCSSAERSSHDHFQSAQ